MPVDTHIQRETERHGHTCREIQRERHTQRHTYTHMRAHTCTHTCKVQIKSVRRARGPYFTQRSLSRARAPLMCVCVCVCARVCVCMHVCMRSIPVLRYIQVKFVKTTMNIQIKIIKESMCAWWKASAAARKVNRRGVKRCSFKW